MKSEIKQAYVVIQLTWQKKLNDYISKFSINEQVHNIMIEMLDEIVLQHNHIGKTANLLFLTLEHEAIVYCYKRRIINYYKTQNQLSIDRFGHRKKCTKTEMDDYFCYCDYVFQKKARKKLFKNTIFEDLLHYY